MSLHRIILRHLSSGSMSLADLQPVADVSLPTLRKAVYELVDARWVRVVGQAETSGGRPAMLFGLDDSHFLIVGVHLQLPGMRLIAADLRGNVLHAAELYRHEVPEPDAAMKAIQAYVSDVREQFAGRHVLGVGIASPGFTDPETGDIISVGRVVGWRNLAICNRLGAMLGVPVRIANDVDCMAFAEFQHTGISFEQNLAYVGFDEGVKISLFLNGELYKGSFSNAGLVSARLLHLEGDFDREDLSRILTISGISEIFERKVAQLNPHDAAQYQSILDQESMRRRFRFIVMGAEDGLPVCREIVTFMQAAVAAAVANIAYFIQPDVLVIGGALSSYPAPMMNALETEIRAYLPTLFTNTLIVQQAKFSSQDSASLGATVHFLQNLLVDNNTDVMQIAEKQDTV